MQSQKDIQNMLKYMKELEEKKRRDIETQKQPETAENELDDSLDSKQTASLIEAINDVTALQNNNERCVRPKTRCVISNSHLTG